MKRKIFSGSIVTWYEENKRDLPWRNTRNPYKIWLSEVILQQTRVKQGLPYYEKFIEKYPNVAALAQAKEQDVLRTWQGLGYYSRARNLHRCAKIIWQEHGGKFPNTYREIIKLPGIGTYTAAAIASFAFDENVAVVDGNVYRVLSRVFGLHDDIATGKGQKAFAQLAQELMPSHDPARYNQGIMEFGALHCTPKSPGCAHCVLAIECEARRSGMQDKLPVKTKKLKIKQRYFNYISIFYKDQLLLKQRKQKDIWQGLYDFHLIETQKPVGLDEVYRLDPTARSMRDPAINLEISHEYVHILSHQRIYATFYTFYVKNNAIDIPLSNGASFHPLDEVLNLPKPVLISRYLNDTFF